MSHNVQICLLSEQPAPNLCPVLDSRFSVQEVVFVTSPQQTKRVPWLEQVLKPRGIKVSTLPVENAFAFDELLATLEAEVQQRKTLGQHLLINATGGTKPMSIAAHMAGFNADVPVFYVQNDHVYWLNDAPAGQRDFDLEERLRLNAYLQAHGCTLLDSGSPQVPPNHMALFYELIEIPSFAGQLKTLNWLAYQARNPNLKATLSDKQKNNQALGALLDKLESAALLKTLGNSVVFAGESERALCNGFWLEDFCLKQATEYRQQDASIQDIQRGVNIKTLGEGDKAVKNELDLALLRHNRLYLIECKTRQFKDGEPDAASALYKLATLSKQIGGNQSRAMLVSFYELRPYDKERARALGVAVVDGPQVLKNFKSHLAQWLKS